MQPSLCPVSPSTGCSPTSSRGPSLRYSTSIVDESSPKSVISNYISSWSIENIQASPERNNRVWGGEGVPRTTKGGFGMEVAPRNILKLSCCELVSFEEFLELIKILKVAFKILLEIVCAWPNIILFLTLVSITKKLKILKL